MTVENQPSLTEWVAEQDGETLETAYDFLVLGSVLGIVDRATYEHFTSKHEDPEKTEDLIQFLVDCGCFEKIGETRWRITSVGLAVKTEFDAA